MITSCSAVQSPLLLALGSSSFSFIPRTLANHDARTCRLPETLQMKRKNKAQHVTYVNWILAQKRDTSQAHTHSQSHLTYCVGFFCCRGTWPGPSPEYYFWHDTSFCHFEDLQWEQKRSQKVTLEKMCLSASLGSIALCIMFDQMFNQKNDQWTFTSAPTLADTKSRGSCTEWENK